MAKQGNQIVSKYLKKFGLSKAKQIVYIMRTSEDEYPKNKYPNWEDYIKRPDLKKYFPFDYENFWCVCSSAIDEMQYQLEHYKGERRNK